MKSRELQVTIANTETTSTDYVDLSDQSRGDEVIAGIMVPAAYDKTTIKFQTSLDATTWAYVIGTDGAALEYTCTGSTLEFISVPPTDLSAVKYLRPVAPAAVGADSLFTFIVRPA